MAAGVFRDSDRDEGLLDKTEEDGAVAEEKTKDADLEVETDKKAEKNDHEGRIVELI